MQTNLNKTLKIKKGDTILVKGQFLMWYKEDGEWKLMIMTDLDDASQNMTPYQIGDEAELKDLSEYVPIFNMVEVLKNIRDTM